MSAVLLFAMMGPKELILIGLVIVLLFGGKKIPELMRGLGRGISEFKKGKEGVTGELKKTENEI